jgi:hypothetical protein
MLLAAGRKGYLCRLTAFRTSVYMLLEPWTQPLANWPQFQGCCGRLAAIFMRQAAERKGIILWLAAQSEAIFTGTGCRTMVQI